MTFYLTVCKKQKMDKLWNYFPLFLVSQEHSTLTSTQNGTVNTGKGAITWLSSVWGVRTHPPPHDFLLWSGGGSGLTYDTMFPVCWSGQIWLLKGYYDRTNRCQLWHKPSFAYETHWLKTARPWARAEAASVELNQRDQKGHSGSSTLSRNTSPSTNNPTIK